jgi:hypothetical protein
MGNKNNDHLVAVCGSSGSGKSASLKDIVNPEGVLYLNTESGKRLPFKSNFNGKTITDPYQIYEAFDYAETKSEIHTIVIDSLVFMMDMFESVHVLTSANTMKAWGDYGQFFKNLMNQKVAKSTKNVIFTSHVSDILNESDMVVEKLIKVKGALMNTSVEAFFSMVIAAKKIPLTKLDATATPLLTITPEEELLGFKHVFQTSLTKETINERLRSPLGMWTRDELYIDNNIQLVMDRLSKYYG